VANHAAPSAIDQSNYGYANIIFLRLGSIVFNTDINTGKLPSGSMIKNNVMAADQMSMVISK
jgi:hypothetical protein